MKDLVKRQLFKPKERADDTNTKDLDPAKRMPDEVEILFRDNF